MTSQPSAVTPGALNPDQHDFPKRLEPRHQARITSRGRIKRRRRQQPTALVQRRRDMHIKVRVDATRDL